MISLNQIRLLEQKIESILDLVSALQSEKAVLENQNAKLKAEVQELAAKCSRFEQDEEKIEQGILSVLNRLNNMEDAVQHVMESGRTSGSDEKNAQQRQEAPQVVQERHEAEPAKPAKPSAEQLDIF